MPAPLRVQGLTELLAEMKGPLFRDFNRELRGGAMDIATELAPEVAAAVRRSHAPQAAKVAATVRPYRDRVPVVSIGKTVPKLSGLKKKKRRKDPEGNFIGSDPKRNRGSIAHGVVYGPLGGHRRTSAHENYYRIGRDNSGGPVGAALRPGGKVHEQACLDYLDWFQELLHRHGFTGSNPVRWGG